MTKAKQDPAAIIRDLRRQLAESEKERAAAVELAEKQRKKIVRLEKLQGAKDGDDILCLIKSLIQDAGMVDAVRLWDWLQHDHLGIERPERIEPEQGDGPF